MSDFDPSKHLTRISGSEYLEVKWRLVWMRDQHPDAEIETELIEHDAGERAVFACRITLPNGGGAATGHGSETVRDFRDYLEKAETKAIGRALAALGFGTQFAPDFVSAPVAQTAGSPRPNQVVNGQRTGPGGGPVSEGAETPRLLWAGASPTHAAPTPQPVMANDGQVRAIYRLWGTVRGGTEETLNEFLADEYTADGAGELTSKQAGDLIAELERERSATRGKG